MPEASFPGPGPDGEQPPRPVGPARDEAAGVPAGVPEDDWDGDAEMAAYIADLDAGRARIPEEWETEGPAATIGLGDAADVDLAGLAVMLGPDGLGGEVFAQDRPADALASKAHIDALAAALRRGGLPGTLQHLRVLAFTDLTQGRNPLDRTRRTQLHHPAHRLRRVKGSGDARHSRLWPK